MANTFLYENYLKTLTPTITVSSAATAYPKEHLYDGNPAKSWRTANASTAHTAVIDFGSAVGINRVAIANPNFTEYADVRIQANATDSWGAPSVEVYLNLSGLGTNPPLRNVWHKFSSTQTYRYWRLYIDDTANPDGFYEVGDFWLGNGLVMSTGQDFQSANMQEYPDRNVRHETEYGHEYVYIRDMGDVRTFNLEWTDVTNSTKNNLRIMERTTYKSGYPFWFVPNELSGDPIEAFFVRMRGNFEAAQSSPLYWTVRFNMDELPCGISLPKDV